MNIIPLHALPIVSFPSSSEEQRLLRQIRINSQPIHGFFLLRRKSITQISGTFLLLGGVELQDRWFLGRIRQHQTQPGRYEILVRSPRLCYYRAVDSQEDLFREIGFMDEDADGEIAEGITGAITGAINGWVLRHDTEFTEMGFE